jgi:hypothetical protein
MVAGRHTPLLTLLLVEAPRRGPVPVVPVQALRVVPIDGEATLWPDPFRRTVIAAVVVVASSITCCPPLASALIRHS